MITSYDTLIEHIKRYAPDVAIISIVDITETLLKKLHYTFPFRRVFVDKDYLNNVALSNSVLITDKAIDGHTCLVCSEKLLRGV